jgi:hypothetical protein
MRSEQEWRQGRLLLKELLPWARAEIAKDVHARAVKESPLANATFPYITEENLEALLIYPAPKGGWHVDLALKHVPPGIPSAIGTPVESPLRTRAEAEAMGKRFLLIGLTIARENRETKAEPTGPVFLLHGYAFKLSPNLLPIALAAMPGHEHGYGTQLQAAGRVEAILDELFPGGVFTPDAYRALPREKQAMLWSRMHIATLSGLFAFPMRQDAPPK